MVDDAQVWVEVWPLAADDDDIWLVTPDAIMEGPATAGKGPVGCVGRVLDVLDYPARSRHDPTRDGVLAIYSPTWRTADPARDGLDGAVILTYLVPLRVPVGAKVPETEMVSAAGEPVGIQPFVHAGQVAALGSLRTDVLAYGLGCLSLLVRSDDGLRSRLGPVWRRHLMRLEPAVGGAYVGEAA